MQGIDSASVGAYNKGCAFFEDTSSTFMISSFVLDTLFTVPYKGAQSQHGVVLI